MSHSGNAELPLPRMRKHQTEFEQQGRGEEGPDEDESIADATPSLRKAE